MSYIFDEHKNLERQRLLGLVQIKLTGQLLDTLNLPPGIRCLDLGCGIGESTRLLAARLGASSETIGLDIDPALLETARKSSDMGAKVTYEQGDARTLPFEDGSFGFVFARCLLQHLPKPEIVLSEMLRVCRPGGIVAVQEPDLSKHYCFPHNWAITKLTASLAKLVTNPVIGLELWSLFNGLGYPSANVNLELFGLYEGTALKRVYCLSLEATRTLLVERGFIDENEVETLLEECRRVEQDEAVLCLGCPFFSAWVVRR